MRCWWQACPDVPAALSLASNELYKGRFLGHMYMATNKPAPKVLKESHTDPSCFDFRTPYGCALMICGCYGWQDLERQQAECRDKLANAEASAQQCEELLAYHAAKAEEAGIAARQDALHAAAAQVFPAGSRTLPHVL